MVSFLTCYLQPHLCGENSRLIVQRHSDIRRGAMKHISETFLEIIGLAPQRLGRRCVLEHYQALGLTWSDIVVRMESQINHTKLESCWRVTVRRGDDAVTYLGISYSTPVDRAIVQKGHWFALPWSFWTYVYKGFLWKLINIIMVDMTRSTLEFKIHVTVF